MTNLFHRNFFAMNTRFEVVSYGKDSEIFTRIFDKIETVVKELETVISCYNTTSEVYGINHEQPVDYFGITAELLKIIELSEKYKQKTRACFDYCLPGNFVYNTAAFQPKPIGAKVELDLTTKKFRFTETGLALDFGAIGKGLALEKAAGILAQNKITNCFISFGDSSILTRGKHPHGPHWPFSLTKIKDCQFQLNEAAVSTSGTLQPDGNLHILDPRSHQRIKEPKLVSVKSSSPVDAEVLSTALLVAEKHEISAILSNFANYEIFIIDDDNNPKIRKFYG
ncbi:MAG: FAD:protein FMN transferase [Fidelibacterota bacterium]